MSTTAVGPTSVRNPWIVGRWWDLTYIVLTPVAIVPIVLLLVQRWLTPEQVSLAVISFASLGHHLPGFLRAYGDRELVARFRVRLIAAPLIIFGMALLFTPPRPVADALGLPWTHLHGLEVILLFWGTWHGLMQTYGFMRIYDLRRGENQPIDAWLDHALCLAIFAGGVLFSDARMFGVANAMWQSGLPYFTRETLQDVRWAGGATCAAVLIAYLWRMAQRWRMGQGLNGPKLLLAAVTGAFFWYAGSLSTNLLIGVAMFEIFHAVQYDAIVWIYNRRLLTRAGERLGPLGALFRDRWSMLGAYLALIAAYSSIRWLAGDGTQYVFFTGEGTDAYQWLFALFVTSSFMHFYLDGFIWKVSERATQQPLVDAPVAASLPQRVAPAARHAAKWSVLLGIAGALLVAERSQVGPDRELSEAQRQLALTALTPDLPECQVLASRLALQAGRADEAVALAQRAAERRARSYAVLGDAGAVLLDAGQYDQALPLLAEAVELAPEVWRYRADLGLAEQGEGRAADAEASYRRAMELVPHEPLPRQLLAQLMLDEGRAAEAVELLGQLADQRPDDAEALCGWGQALAAAGESAAARDAFARAVALAPESADAQYLLGTAELAAGRPGRAVAPLRRAAALASQHGEARLHLGLAFYQLEKWQAAAEALAEAVRLLPDRPEPYLNLGSALLQAGDLPGAEAAYVAGLRAAPDSPELNYNLGMLWVQTGRVAEGRARLERAGRPLDEAP